MRKQKITISVIGGHQISSDVEDLAYHVGRVVANCGATLVCGGLSGSMEFSAKGAKEAGGTTIGLLPGNDKDSANPYIDIALPTTIGFARNAMVAASADIIVALPGSNGTSCEISYGLVYNRPIINLGGWGHEGLIQVKDIDEAEEKIKELIKGLLENCDGSK